MSALGHEQTSRHVRLMYVIPLKSGHSSASSTKCHQETLPQKARAHYGLKSPRHQERQGSSIVPLYLPPRSVSVSCSRV
jgi:hypothetical protein